MLRRVLLAIALLAGVVGATYVSPGGLPVAAVPAPSDILVGDHGGVTSQFTLGSFNSLFVDLLNPQTIQGPKTFASPPAMSGASISSGTIPLASLATSGTPLTFAQGGTGTASPNPTATGCGTLTGTWPSTVTNTTACATATTGPSYTTVNVTSLSASSPICSDASKNISSSCSAINYDIINIGLGFFVGTVATANTYPYQQEPGYSNGEITKIRVACATADGGTTVFHIYDNGSDITGSPWTLAAATTSTFTLGTPFALTAGHVLHMAVTTAGTGASCGFTAEGQQTLQ